MAQIKLSISSIILAILCNLSPIFAQEQLSSQNNIQGSPKLIVGVVVDQMRYDYLERFSNKFSEHGFKRLLKYGYSCENNYINYMPSNTAPGHATIYTGVRPNTHGIINNSWFDAVNGRVVYCTNDPSVEPVGTGSKTERNSPFNLQAPSISDVYKQQKPGGKTISVAIKDRSAVLSGGKKADAAYWFRGRDQGSWISSSYYLEALPKWVHDFNDSELLQQYMTTWSTLFPIDTYKESGPDDSRVERGFKDKVTPTFPYDLTSLVASNGNYDIIKSTPFGNSFTVDFALAALQAEQLGVNGHTDFLMIGLSSTDYIGHNFGVDSKEVEDAYVRLDRDILRLLNALDARVGAGNYTLFLSSDHGAHHNPNFQEEFDMEDSFFKAATFKDEIREFAFENYGDANLIHRMIGNDIYFNREVLNLLNLNTAEVAQSIRDFVAKQPQIAFAYTRDRLMASPVEDKAGILLQNGFHPDRSGDVLFVLDPTVVDYSKKGSGHGSPYKRDTHVPLIFYGAGIQAGVTSERTNPVDIVPTLARILQLSPETNWAGKAIEAALK